MASTTPLAAPLTREGVLLGTPAYMAPEQYGTTRVDAKADQFSFCVALYEALYGERPFQGDTLWELMGRVALGKTRPVPASSPVPPWVRDAVLKGLAPDPGARHASMEALLQALTTDPHAKRRRRLRIAAVIAGFAVLAALAVAGLLDSDAPPCRAGRSDLAGVWDGTTRAAVRAAFLKTRRPYAAETVVRLEQTLDDYATAWAAMRNEACEATEVRHQQSERLLALRMQCLDRRRARLAALTTLLRADIDVALLDRAVVAAHGLQPLARCADATALSAGPPQAVDKATRARVDALRRRVFDAEALGELGRATQGLPVAVAAVEEARLLGYRPLLAEALHVLSHLQDETGDAKAAAAGLEQAARTAAEAKADALAAQIWIDLLRIVGHEQARHADAAPIQVAAEAAVARAGDDELMQARLLYTVGLVLRAQGDHTRSREHFEKALAIRERRLGAEHPDVAEPLDGLGAILEGEGRHAEAAERYRRVLRIRVKQLGFNHPRTSHWRVLLGGALLDAGRLAEAQKHFERAVAVSERAVGRDHVDVAAALTGLGDVLRLEGTPATALPHLERALRIRTAHPGDPVELARTRLALARALPDRDHDRALSLATGAQQALAKAGAAGAKDLAAAEAWLAKRRGK